MKVWMNGELVDEAAALLPYNDHGVTVGDGVFESLETVGGRPFAVRRHLERLVASATGLGLDAPDVELLRGAIDEVVAANGAGAGVVRVTVTGGAGPLGSARGTCAPTVIVATMAAPVWPVVAAVAVVPWPRNERGALSGLKTTSYAENVVALAHARRRGAAEAIFANTVGNLCEGTGTNVFLAVEGRIVTPPLSAGCLAGVTRALVIELVGAEEIDLPVAALAAADEAFLTSTTRGVQAIGTVDGQALPSAPGPLTIEAVAAFAALVARDLDP